MNQMMLPVLGQVMQPSVTPAMIPQQPGAIPAAPMPAPQPQMQASQEIHSLGQTYLGRWNVWVVGM